MAVSAVLNYVALPFRTRKTSKASVNKTKKGLRQTPAYTPEEMLFTWYHRTDLKLDWDVVEYLYNKCFNRWPRQKGGLQCKFYRYIADWGVARVRVQKRTSQIRKTVSDTDHDLWTAEFGVTKCTDHIFGWMLPEHRLRQVRSGKDARLAPPWRSHNAKMRGVKQAQGKKESRL
ncbi:uncharacterized protein HMPREF1541_00758 [Cyphellophora europaea CBS 101466]|uniref:Uncharacterized protein n=1 Tax=Cyphellophora europaea (strain CBS 101466) TaxID=1220924 RepID=W2SEW4_CYPE1|nr:uncharacterized protein HMPREF1541_00758 [Cyphellophora europaea CBS 101466]ETN46573.1 hypothetical protein HMPREF1541_00758 [Cyphellophora europaea CBS 101466]